jgi:hypothetical protein
MIKSISAISGINNYYDIYRDKICCIIDNTMSIFDFFGKKMIEFKKNQSTTICVLENTIITQDLSLEKQVIINPITFKVEKELDFMVDLTPFNLNQVLMNDIVVPIVVIKGETYRGLITLPNWELKKIFPVSYGLNGIWKILNNNCFLSKKDSFLTCHPLGSGEEKWRLDVSEIGGYMRMGDWRLGQVVFMETYDEVLCLVLGNDMVLGVNIEDGRILWQRQMLTNLINCPTFHEGRMYWFSPLNEDSCYLVVDMKTGVDIVKIIPMPEILLEECYFTQPTLHEGKLYMTGKKGRVIYIVNPQNCEVLETAALPGAGERIPIYNAPRIAGNRLYQLDGDSNLHIFEME